MTLLEAIPLRHSVRRYTDQPLASEAVEALNARIAECNAKGHLHIQLVQNEPRAFKGILAYGTFSGVTDYLVVTGKKGKADVDGLGKNIPLDLRAGYFGEELVLFAQTLGLDTCWVGLSYRKVANTFTLDEDEKLVCYIALGYGQGLYHKHKVKSIEDVSNVSASTPEWFRKGIEAALLAPTAVNQQKFHFEYIAPTAEQVPQVKATTRFSMIGYTQIDLGIAMCHFALAAAPNNFEWIL